MAELADALDSGSSRGSSVKVQVLLPAPNKRRYATACRLLFGLCDWLAEASQRRRRWGNVWRFAKQMTVDDRQGKLAAERSEAGSTCPFTRTNKKELLLLFLFLGFLHHFDLKNCLLKKLFPTLLTPFFWYVILDL